MNSNRWMAFRGGLALSFACSVALPAAAEDVELPASKAAKPTIDVAVPPPPAPEGREYRTHEGGYLRANVGLGSFSASGDQDLSTGGMSLAFDLLLGYDPAPGFALGAGVIGDLQLSGDWEVGSTNVGSGDMTALLVGPFVDAYPNPQGGWHFGALAGLGVHTYDAGAAADDDSTTALGFGAAAWAGHDVWVGDEFSVGGNLRLDASRASKDDVAVARIGLSLSFSVTYN